MKPSLPIDYVFLEGPDLTGKTTLYRSVHKATGYRYNLIDRSFLSRVCYSRQYGRSDLEDLRLSLRNELSRLNNVLVVLLLPVEELLRRLAVRGDELQDEKSIVELHRIFSEEVAAIQHMPNVFIVKDVLELAELTSRVVSFLQQYEVQPPAEVGQCIRKWVSGLSQKNKEAQISVRMHVSREYKDSISFMHPDEHDYYSEIFDKLYGTIHDEISGKNPYAVPQTLDSRRFYYNSDTCISSIHYLPRPERPQVLCTLRSTDVVKNAAIDLSALAHISAMLFNKFAWPGEVFEMSVNFNNAHVRRDV